MEYTIQAASRVSGLSAHTLRAWERRYNAVTPIRDDVGRRVYQKSQVDRLILLNRLCQLGYSIGQLAGKNDEELLKMLSSLGEDPSNISYSSGINASELKTIKGSLSLALRFFKLDVIAHELEKLSRRVNTKLLWEQLFPEILSELNQLIDNQVLNKSQVQAVTELLTSQMKPVLMKTQDQLELEKPQHLIIQPLANETTIDNFGVELVCNTHQLKTLNLGIINDLKSFELLVSSLDPKCLILDFSHNLDEKNKSELLKSLRNIIGQGKEREYIFISPNFEIQNTSGVALHSCNSIYELNNFFNMRETRH